MKQITDIEDIINRLTEEFPDMVPDPSENELTDFQKLLGIIKGKWDGDVFEDQYNSRTSTVVYEVDNEFIYVDLDKTGNNDTAEMAEFWDMEEWDFEAIKDFIQDNYDPYYYEPFSCDSAEEEWMEGYGASSLDEENKKLLAKYFNYVSPELSKEITKSIDWIKASVVININGWLGSGRGMKIALALRNALDKKDVAFILVGKLDCLEAKELAQKENVQYLGEVSNADALSSYLASDFVFTYYDPSSVINTLAASNKWGDAIKTGIGVIVNSEVITANYLHEAGVSVSYPYDNVKDLSTTISEYISDGSKIKVIKENSRNISNEFGYFENQLEKLLYEN